MSKQQSFASLELAQRINKQSALSKVDALIDWESLRPALSDLHKRDQRRHALSMSKLAASPKRKDSPNHQGGQTPFDPVMMFKAILLGQWHSLSDPKLEEALTVRIDFLQFCQLSLNDPIPDETTLCRFRNKLIHAGKLEGLLKQVNAQLQGHGLMVKNAPAAIIDATLIVSAARPRGEHIIEHDDNQTQNQPPSQNANTNTNTNTAVTPSSTTRLSADTDATWLKKGKRSTFGYRSYAAVDGQDGYIRATHSRPANESEFQHLAPTLAGIDYQPQRTYADKGFSSKDNRAHLHSQGIKSGLMHRANKHKPLSKRQHSANKIMSKTRWIVEQAFGTVKRRFQFIRASYFGLDKVQGQFTMKAMCYNLLKAANKICLIEPTRGVVRPQRR